MATLDELAQRYLLLVLRLWRHRPDLVASYVGPPELREAVDGEQPTLLVELHDEALTLRELLAEHPPTPRTRWLAGQLRALAAVARTLAGEEIEYVDLVEQLYGVPLTAEPDGTFAAAHRMLDAALPPGDTLRERLADYRRAARLPAGGASEAAAAVLSLLRRRTREDVWLPADEAAELAFVSSDGSRPARITYRGRGRSRLELDAERHTPAELVSSIAHQAYPGHHTERATREALLVRRRGWPEAAVATRFTPEWLVSEGIASIGREVVLTDQELAVEVGRIARVAGVRIEPQREVAVAGALEHLAPATSNAAILLHHDGVPEADVRDYLAEVALLDDAAIPPAFDRLRDPLGRAAPITDFAGLRQLREWFALQGQTRGLARALSEPLTPADLSTADA